MLLPGQERAVFTKETLIMNVMSEALFDNFYLGWALDLDAVRKQWSRVVFQDWVRLTLRAETNPTIFNLWTCFQSFPVR